MGSSASTVVRVVIRIGPQPQVSGPYHRFELVHDRPGGSG